MNLETIICERRGDTTIITLNRPDALNALSLQLTKDLSAALHETVQNGTRAVVLTGSGRGFCAGGDLREMRQIADQTGNPAAFFEEPLEHLHACIELIRRAPIPFIAAVNGICAGAGTNFALACDIVFAAENAAFNEGFVKIGLSPDCGGTYFLPRVVGEKRAAEMFFTGESISAADALAFGMINRVTTAETLLPSAVEFAEKLAKMPTASIAKSKQLLAQSSQNTLAEQLAAEHKAQIESGQTADFKEGVMSFFEKRPPNFQGR